MAKFLNKLKVPLKGDSQGSFDTEAGGQQPHAWAPSTAMPMWPPPGHTGWTPPPGGGAPGQGLFSGQGFAVPGFGGPGGGRPVWVVNPMHIMSLSKTKFSKTKSSLVKFIEFSRGFTEKWFSHILLIALLILYAALGAWMFMVLEGQVEVRSKAPVLNMKDRIKREMWYYTKDNPVPRHQLDRIIDHRLQEYEQQVYEHLKSGPPPDLGSEVSRTRWTFWKSFVYCFTVFTTIGYGHIAPVTRMGRAATIAYACVGIPLLLMVLADLGRLFTRMIKYGFKSLRKLFMAKKLRKVRHAGRRATLVPQYMAHMAHTAQNKLESTGMKVKKTLKHDQDGGGGGSSNHLEITDSRSNLESNQGSKFSLNEEAPTLSDEFLSQRKSSLNLSTGPSSNTNTLERPQRKKKKVMIDSNDGNNNQNQSKPDQLSVKLNDQPRNKSYTSIDVPDVPMVQVTAPGSPQFIYSPGIGPAGHPLTAHPLGHNIHPLMITPTGLTPTPINEDGEIVLDGDQEIQEIVDPVTGQKSMFIVDDEFNLPVSLALLILVLYMMLGALLFTISDNWSFFDSFYFVFISISTIGLGDLTPNSDLWMIAASIYLLFGLALTSMCINVIQEALGTAFEEAKLRLGTRIGFDVADGRGQIPDGGSGIDGSGQGENPVKGGQSEEARVPGSRRNSEEEKLRRKARAESQERRRRRDEKKKRKESISQSVDRNGIDRQSKDRKDSKDSGGSSGSKSKSMDTCKEPRQEKKKEVNEKELKKEKKEVNEKELKKEKKNPVTFAEVKQSAPVITFKLSEGQELGKNLKERRKKKREGELSPGIYDQDSPDNVPKIVGYTTTEEYPKTEPIPHPSPATSIKSEYQDAVNHVDS